MKPVLFYLFGNHDFPVRAYGAFVGAALVVAMTLGVRYARRLGIAGDRLLDAGFGGVVAGLVGGRLMYVIVHLGDFTSHPLDALKVWEGGMMYFGGLVLGLAWGVWAAWRKGIPLWPSLDVAAPCIGAGQALGRLACLVAGCCYGQPIEGGHWELFKPVGIVFTDPMAAGTPLDRLLIPTQLIQVFEGLGLFTLGVWLLRRRRWDGQAFVITMAAAGLSRYLIEGLRGDPARGFLLPSVFGETFSSSRVLGIGMIAAALGLWIWRRRQALSVDPALRLHASESR